MSLLMFSQEKSYGKKKLIPYFLSNNNYLI